MSRQLTAIAEREGDGYAVPCPKVDIASQGNALARDNLEEALTPFFETAPAEEVEKRLRSEVYATRVGVAVGQDARPFRSSSMQNFRGS